MSLLSLSLVGRGQISFNSFAMRNSSVSVTEGYHSALILTLSAPALKSAKCKSFFF